MLPASTTSIGWPHSNAIWIPISDIWPLTSAYVSIQEIIAASWGCGSSPVWLKNEDRYCTLIRLIASEKHSVSLEFTVTELAYTRAV
jgi:hypothetical protein